MRHEILKKVDPSVSAPGPDKFVDYISVGQEFAKHVRVDHDDGQYVLEGIRTNMAENFFSRLKRSIDWTHHPVGVEHLPRYLVEFDFRFTTRKESDTKRSDAPWGR